MMQQLSTSIFTWIRTININWAKKQSVDNEKRIIMTACLFHYSMDVGLLMRYLGNNYNLEYCDMGATENIPSSYSIDHELI